MKSRKNLNRPGRGSKIKVEPIKRVEDIETIKLLLADNPRNFALFTVGINTDLRVGELLSIKMGQVQDIEWADTIQLKVTRGKDKRTVRLNRACVEAIRMLLRERQHRRNNGPDSFLFSGSRGALTVPSVNHLVKKWCAAVKLKGNYGGHTLRKTFGYHQLVRFKMSLPDIMVQFNHFKPEQTLSYLCVQPEELRHPDQTRLSKIPDSTCEELTQRIKELEDIVGRLRESEEKFRTIFENVNDEIIYLDNDGTILEINDRCEDLFGLKRKEVIGKKFFDFAYMSPEDMQALAEQFKNRIIEKRSYMQEVEIVRTDGASVVVETNSKFIESAGEIKGTLAILRDVTERKRVEKELQIYRNHLEELVRERTCNLEEANAALRVMLRMENEVKEELEDKILVNVKELILPALEKIKHGINSKYYLGFIESNLNHILSSFAHKLSSSYFNLTPTQLRIANFIKDGKSTKEIAELLNLSKNTIHFHRANIRKKVGISKHKTNLRSFLLALE